MQLTPIAKLCTSLLITIIAGHVSYKVITENDRRYFNAIQKNEFIFKHDTTTYDVLMLGASRMKNTLNPKIFDSITGLNSYNAGISAARIYEQKVVFDAYLVKHKPPKYLLMTLDLVTMEKRAPYYPNYLTCADLPPIKKMLNEEGVHTSLYRYLPFLSLVELNEYYKGCVLKNLLSESELAPGDYQYKGYVSNTTDTIIQDKLGNEADAEYSVESFALLQSIVDTARKYNIQVVFTYAPEYKQLNEKSVENAHELFMLYKNFATKNGLNFYRHDTLPMCNERRYFANNGHVNRIGADEYSRIYGSMFKAGKLTTVR